jgi:hypothetical protein
MSVWNGAIALSKDGQYWQTEWRKTASEQFASAFCEPFIVYERTGDYFFVTTSGKLFESLKPEKGGRGMIAVGAKQKLVVQAVITDAKSGKTFVFAEGEGEAGGPRCLWFEMKNDVRFEEYVGKRLSEARKKEGTEHILFHVTDFLLSRKAIKKPGES